MRVELRASRTQKKRQNALRRSTTLEKWKAHRLLSYFSTPEKAEIQVLAYLEDKERNGWFSPTEHREGLGIEGTGCHCGIGSKQKHPIKDCKIGNWTL